MSGYRTLHREEGSIKNPIWSVTFVGNTLYASTAAGCVHAYQIEQKSVSDATDNLDARGLYIQHFETLHPYSSRKSIASNLMLCKVKAARVEDDDDNDNDRSGMHHNIVCAASIDGKVIIWHHHFDVERIKKSISGVVKSVGNVYTDMVYSCENVTGTNMEMRPYNYGNMHAAVGCRNGNICILGVGSEKDRKRAQLGSVVEVIESSHLGKACVMSLAWSSDSNILASGLKNGMVDIYQRSHDGNSARFTFSKLHSIVAHQKPVRALYFTHDNQILLTSGDDSKIQSYEVDREASKVRLTNSHRDVSWVLDVVSHPDSRRIMSAHADKKVKVWNLTMRESVHTFDGAHTDKVWGLSVNNDGTRIASCGDDGKIVVYSCDEK